MPPHDDERRAEVDDWLTYAASDLSVARGPRAEGALPAVYAFHAQQAAEKILKAVLIAHDVEPPRTHNIRELSALIESRTPHEMPEHLYYMANLLTQYAVESRYPDELGDVSEDELETAISMAGDVFAWALEALGL
jgi:HEPN domain-containing protein